MTELEKLMEMTVFERELYETGVKFVAGVDEVGRGPLAGDVYAAAVILPADVGILGINDSKKLTVKKREILYEQIKEHAISIGVGIADVAEIDEHNILGATKIAMLRAIENLKLMPEHLLIDALNLDVEIAQTKIIKGDTLSVSIAAASIVAKVERDRYMKTLAKEYSYYGFETNSGYGTKAHLAGIDKHGYIEGVHRLSFEPVKSIITKNNGEIRCLK